MTDIVEWVVLALAVVAAWLSVRPAPPLDWERLWKTILATIIRGDVEASGGDAEDWWRRLSGVPYHPAGRQAVSKLTAPSLDEIPVPALEGERALVERLAAKETIRERWEAMYRDDPLAEEALLMNPAELGPAYDPASALAPKIGWEEVAQWTAETQSAVARRMQDVVVAVLGMDADPWIEAVPHARVMAIPDPDDSASLEAALLELCPRPQDRLLVVSAGGSAYALVHALHGSPSLRDRVLVVAALGPDLRSGEREQWMQENFQHLAFDTELNRQTLYMAASVVTMESLHLVDQCFPNPPVPPSGWAPIQAIDLGLLDLESQRPDLLARALWVLLCFCLSSR